MDDDIGENTSIHTDGNILPNTSDLITCESGFESSKKEEEETQKPCDVLPVPSHKSEKKLNDLIVPSKASENSHNDVSEEDNTNITDICSNIKSESLIKFTKHSNVNNSKSIDTESTESFVNKKGNYISDSSVYTKVPKLFSTKKFKNSFINFVKSKDILFPSNNSSSSEPIVSPKQNNVDGDFSSSNTQEILTPAEQNLPKPNNISDHEKSLEQQLCLKLVSSSCSDNTVSTLSTSTRMSGPVIFTDSPPKVSAPVPHKARDNLNKINKQPILSTYSKYVNSKRKRSGSPVPCISPSKVTKEDNSISNGDEKKEVKCNHFIFSRCSLCSPPLIDSHEELVITSASSTSLKFDISDKQLVKQELEFGDIHNHLDYEESSTNDCNCTQSESPHTNVVSSQVELSDPINYESHSIEQLPFVNDDVSVMVQSDKMNCDNYFKSVLESDIPNEQSVTSISSKSLEIEDISNLDCDTNVISQINTKFANKDKTLAPDLKESAINPNDDLSKSPGIVKTTFQCMDLAKDTSSSDIDMPFDDSENTDKFLIYSVEKSETTETAILSVPISETSLKPSFSPKDNSVIHIGPSIIPAETLYSSIKHKDSHLTVKNSQFTSQESPSEPSEIPVVVCASAEEDSALVLSSPHLKSPSLPSDFSLITSNSLAVNENRDVDSSVTSKDDKYVDKVLKSNENLTTSYEIQQKSYCDEEVSSIIQRGCLETLSELAKKSVLINLVFKEFDIPPRLISPLAKTPPPLLENNVFSKKSQKPSITNEITDEINATSTPPSFKVCPTKVSVIQNKTQSQVAEKKPAVMR